MRARRTARVSGLALVLGLAACSSSPMSVADPAATAAPAARASAAPEVADAPVTERPPQVLVPGNPTRRSPLSAAPLPASASPGPAGLSAPRVPLQAEVATPDGVPFVPVTPKPRPSLAATPVLGPEVTATSAASVFVPEEQIPVPVLPVVAPALTVPFGRYVAGGYDGTSTVYTAAMQVRSDGTYSMNPDGGAELPDPAKGEDGTYEVLGGSSLAFLTGPFAGSEASVIPDYQATGDDFIDLMYDGVFVSFRFDPA